MKQVIRSRELGPDSCTKCGNQPRFVASMLDPPSGRTFYMLKCLCGDKTCLSLSPGAVAGRDPTNVRHNRQ